jgi:hypothetical protein
MPYAEKGVALGIYRKDDVAPTIQNALQNEEVRERLGKAQEKFVYEYAYVQDGKASERVADLIMHTLEESKE